MGRGVKGGGSCGWGAGGCGGEKMGGVGEVGRATRGCDEGERGLRQVNGGEAEGRRRVVRGVRGQ